VGHGSAGIGLFLCRLLTALRSLMWLLLCGFAVLWPTVRHPKHYCEMNTISMMTLLSIYKRVRSSFTLIVPILTNQQYLFDQHLTSPNPSA